MKTLLTPDKIAVIRKLILDAVDFSYSSRMETDLEKILVIIHPGG